MFDCSVSSQLAGIGGTLAQLVEQRTFNPFVVGSTPARPTKIPSKNAVVSVSSH